MRGEGCVGGVGNEPARAGESIDDCWGGDRKWEGAGGLSGSAGEGRERAKDVIIDDRGPLTAPEWASSPTAPAPPRTSWMGSEECREPLPT